MKSMSSSLDRRSPTPPWERASLATLSAFITKGSTPTTYGFKWEPSGVLFLRSECVSEHGLDLNQSMFISEEAHATFSRSHVQPHDLLVTITGNVGRVVMFEGADRANLNQHIARVRISAPNAHPAFVYYWLSQTSIRRYFSGITTGQAYPQISLQQVRNAEIPLAPLDEQRAIAAALSDVDALLGGLDRLIAKKRDLQQAAMQQLLTGHTRLPGFHGEWVVTTLFELAEKRKELFDDGDWIESAHITDHGVRLVQTGNIGIGTFIEKDAKKYIHESSFTSLRCKELKPGDLLVCRLADPAGRACVLPDIGEERVVTSVDVTIVRPPADRVDRVFLLNLLSTPLWFRTVSDRSGGTTHKRISRGALGRIPVQIPPMQEQAAIAAVLSEMHAELSALETRRYKTRALKQGMMQELLTGGTRLVSPETAHA